MTSDRFFDTLACSIREILPDLPADRITPDASLKALGANSIERAEIILETLSTLGLKIPMTKFAEARNLADIAAILRAA